MAMVVRVKPEYNGKIAVQSSNSYNGIVLSNNLSQETLVQIYNTEDELRDFLYTEYTTVGDSYAPSQIDPSLIHAYASEEITHNPAKTDYPANSVGKQLYENSQKLGNFETVKSKPTLIMDFAGAKRLPHYVSYSRQGIASYIDKFGNIKYAPQNTPRFTHNPLTLESLGLLQEEERTNLVPNSTAFSLNVLLSNLGTSIAPDGTLTATKIEKNTTANSTFDVGNLTLSNNFYVRSIHIQPLQQTECLLVFEGVGIEGGSGGKIVFDAITKTFSGDTNLVLEYGFIQFKNGWLRPFIVVEKSTTKIVNSRFYLGGYGGASNNSNTCNVWGAQIEAGKKLSSYIPSNGSPGVRYVDKPLLKKAYIPKELTALFTGVSYSGWEKSQNGISKILAQSAFSVLEVPRTNITVYDGVNSLTTNANGYSNSNIGVQITSNQKKLVYESNVLSSPINNQSRLIEKDLGIGHDGTGINCLNGTIKRITIYGSILPDDEIKLGLKTNPYRGIGDQGMPSNQDLNELAFSDFKTVLSAKSRQEFSIDGTGASVTRNIRRDYDFDFEIVDSTGVTLTAQPASSCTAGTDNALTFTAPLGKTLTYAITPVYEN